MLKVKSGFLTSEKVKKRRNSPRKEKLRNQEILIHCCSHSTIKSTLFTLLFFVFITSSLPSSVLLIAPTLSFCVREPTITLVVKRVWEMELFWQRVIVIMVESMTLLQVTVVLMKWLVVGNGPCVVPLSFLLVWFFLFFVFCLLFWYYFAPAIKQRLTTTQILSLPGTSTTAQRTTSAMTITP